MATPNVTIDIADFLTGQLPASKGGYPVTLVPVPDVAPRWRNAFTDSSGAATLSAVVPGTYVLRIGGLGIPDRTVTVPDESGPLAASDLTVGGTTSAAVPTQSNPLLAGSNITLTQKASGLEIAASGGGGEGTASGDVAFTDTDGALSVESSVADGASAVAVIFGTAEAISDTSARLLQVNNATDEKLSVGPEGGIGLGGEWVPYWFGGDLQREFVSIINAEVETPTVAGFYANIFNEDTSRDDVVYLTVNDTRSILNGLFGSDIFSLKADAATGPTLTLTGSNGPRTVFTPSVADGVSSVAYLLDTTFTLSNSGAKILACRCSGAEKFAVAAASGAGQTSLFLWDADNNTLERVTVGAADSGGSGFKVLRIPN